MNNKNRKEKECEVWKLFISELAGKSRSEVGMLLGRALSEKEKQHICYRLIAVDLLAQGKTYREIGDAVWLSPQTISAIKKSFLNHTDNYKGYRSSYRQKKTLSVTVSRKRKPRSIIPKFSVLDAWDVHEYRAKFKNKR